MALVLRLTDGTTTLDLNDGTNYAIPYDGRNTWTPAISKRRRSGLGGLIYQDTEERIPLHIRGATGQDALDNLDALINMLDQAERWYMGENVAVVYLEYLPHNSNLGSVVKCEVLGPVGDTTPWLRLTPYLHDPANYELPEIEVRILRRGDWLGDEDSDTATATGPAALMTCTLAESVPLFSPLSVKLAGMDYQTVDDGLYPVEIPKGLLLVARSADYIKLIQAEEYDSSLSSAVTDVVDSTASDGTYIRMTTGQSVTYTGLITDGLEGADLIGVYAMCHLTSSTDKWQIRTDIHRARSSGADESFETIVINGLTQYAPVRLGVVGRASANFDLRIAVTRLSGLGSIEFDVIALLALGAPSEQAIATNAITFVDAAASAQLVNMGIRHNRLDELRPEAYIQLASGGQGVAWPYEGVIHLTSIGDEVVTMWLAGGSQWQHNDDAGIVSLALTASRRRSYLTPR